MTSQVRESDDSAAGQAQEQERRAGPPDLVDSGLLFARTTQLACEGAVSLLLRASVRDVWDDLVRAGLEWEEEFTRVPQHRRLKRAERP
ncbi:MAG TPA: hypothetical protein VGK33_16200 [Chloroflexota bacterium]|jgi:hypothetical protein